MQSKGSAHGNVLIVDDDRDLRSTVRLTLESRFGVVGEAANGAEAINFVRKHHPRVVVLDSKMPAMNGETAASIIRQISPETHIIAFSGQTATAPAWADAYLHKDAALMLEGLLEISLAGSA